MTEGPGFALHMLPPEAFPFTILAYKAEPAVQVFRMLGTTKVTMIPRVLHPVWEREVIAPVEGTLGAVHIPPLHKEFGPVVIAVRWDNPDAGEPPHMFWPNCSCEHERSQHKYWTRCTAPGCSCHKYRPVAP